MKNKVLIILVIAVATIVVAGFLIFEFLPKTYWSPSWQFGLFEQEKHQRAEEFKNSTTDELISYIDSNRDWKEYKGKKKDSKFIIFKEAIRALGSRTDEKAMSKLKEIILTFPEGQKWTAVSAIRESKNKAMIPVLCEALKKHTLHHTDDLIVKAIVDIDDPVALDCLIQEIDKLSYRTSRELAEKAIEKWSRK